MQTLFHLDQQHGSDSSLPRDYRTSRYRLSFAWTNYMAQTLLYLEIIGHPGTDSPSPRCITWLRLPLLREYRTSRYSLSFTQINYLAQTPLFVEIIKKTSRYRLSFTWTTFMAQTPLYLEIIKHPGTDSPSPSDSSLPRDYRISRYRLSFIWISYIFWGGFFFVLYSTLLHLPPLRFHCADGCWDRTQDR